MKKVEKKSDGFYQPIAVDDWGNVGYYLSAVQSDSGTWGHAEQDQSLRLKEGDKVLVRWPDKSESEEVLVSRGYTRTINDMGHKYEVSGDYLVVVSLLRGVETDVPITSLWVKRTDPPTQEDLAQEVQRLRMALQAVADVHPETGISRIKAFARTALLNAKQRYDLKKEGT